MLQHVQIPLYKKYSRKIFGWIILGWDASFPKPTLKKWNECAFVFLLFECFTWREIAAEISDGESVYWHFLLVIKNPLPLGLFRVLVKRKTVKKKNKYAAFDNPKGDGR